ncbi:DUF1491 family protein [Sphingomonas aracearum]|uniref:DUF1491 family protein n=1 Tax=Sphingomonas aracearum TaxID=2283317 RepID=A0A369VRS4_9SPHN|nr:DUF1491 family protein [Sphingomonas aracearum]RDE04579.1 DUF1491 family protein [Sphingomonas aracearum]
MSDRLPSGMLVSALLRQANDAGGLGVVLARGDAQAGAILVIAEEHGTVRLLERGLDATGRAALVESGPQHPASADEVSTYWQKRRRSDPDLWVLELIVPSAKRLVAETLL